MLASPARQCAVFDIRIVPKKPETLMIGRGDKMIKLQSTVVVESLVNWKEEYLRFAEKPKIERRKDLRSRRSRATINVAEAWEAITEHERAADPCDGHSVVETSWWAIDSL